MVSGTRDTYVCANAFLNPFIRRDGDHFVL